MQAVERMIPRVRLVRRLWQCWERLYGAEGWEPRPSDIRHVIARYLDGEVFISDRCSALPTVTEVPFKTEQDAQWVIEQLQSEGLL